MKKSIINIGLVAVWIIACLAGNAQETKLSMGVILQPSYTHLISAPAPFKGKLAGKGALNIHYRINQKLVLITGISYGIKRTALEDIPNTYNLIDSAGNIDYDNVTYYDIQEQYQYFEIPLKLGYRFNSEKRTSFFLTAGINAGYLAGAKSRHRNVIMDGENADFDVNFTNENLIKRFNISANIGAGICQTLNSRFSLNVLPEFSYDLTPISFVIIPGSELIQEYKFYGFILNIGLFYKFAKPENE